MTTAKLLISLPHDLALRLKSAVPDRQRSKLIKMLIETEVTRREALLYEAALAVEKDQKLSDDMQAWDVAIGDGIDDDESW
jgi:metal-responsive CopG/Arc/MetJ family transcriptional regulator